MERQCAFVAGVWKMSAGPPTGEREYNQAIRRATDLARMGEVNQAKMLVRAAGATADRSRPSAKAVGLALQILEKQKKREKIELTPPSGQFRLVLVANEKKNKREVTANYVPVYGGISFFAEDGSDKQGVVTNTAKLPVLGGIQFTGRFEWVSKMSKLQFNFYSMALRIFWLPALRLRLKGDKKQSDVEIFQAEDPRKLPFFSFFFVEPEIIAARGRGGGLALWRLESVTKVASL
mmetsp:Transcript_5718/g.17018  ORF Transcript_5718/g.17018 Transcript_5718/m.17018 type:complete len:235 (-) Transcript_5718:96-800(-)